MTECNQIESSTGTGTAVGQAQVWNAEIAIAARAGDGEFLRIWSTDSFPVVAGIRSCDWHEVVIGKICISG